MELEKRLLESRCVGCEVMCVEAAAELKAQRERIDTLSECIGAALTVLPTQKEPHENDSLQKLVNLAAGLLQDGVPESTKDAIILTLRGRIDEAQADRDHWEEEAAKNHSQTLEAMQENGRLRETGDHLLWAIGVSGMSPSVQKAVSKFKAALGEQDGD